MKQILFNTEMVRAILDNRKTVTRRVTDVRVERLQNIDNVGIFREGGSIRKPFSEIETFIFRSQFKDLWNSTIKKSDRALYGWDANPWVWVIEFERISREDIC